MVSGTGCRQLNAKILHGYRFTFYNVIPMTYNYKGFFFVFYFFISSYRSYLLDYKGARREQEWWIFVNHVVVHCLLTCYFVEVKDLFEVL